MVNLCLKQEQLASHVMQYGIALGFGLIHGLGYANYIRMILSADQQLVWGLLSFKSWTGSGSNCCGLPCAVDCLVINKDACQGPFAVDTHCFGCCIVVCTEVGH